MKLLCNGIMIKEEILIILYINTKIQVSALTYPAIIIEAVTNDVSWWQVASLAVFQRQVVVEQFVISYLTEFIFSTYW